MTFRPSELLAGRRLLVTGATGFLGKVWLAHLLEHLPETELVLVVRPGGGRAEPHERARRRLVELVETSPAFRALHQRLGPEELARRVARVRVLAGDVGAPRLGLDLQAPDRQELGALDLVVHLAGLTDLDPELGPALEVNVQGALEALELARASGAQLVHVSTAYVAGRRRGRIPERVEPDAPAAPRGASFEAARELTDLRAIAASLRDELRDPRVASELRERAEAARRRLGLERSALERLERREREEHLARRGGAEGRARAKAWGWPNLYTETKALAEALLAERRGALPLTIARPAIVEAAWRDPFPGWNEGLHTSAPLTYALTHGPLRALPARPELVLDVVPVDEVARGLTLACAAALAEPPRAPRVLHLGSSTSNPFSLRRVIELTALARREPRAGAFTARELLELDAAAGSEPLYRAQVPLARRLLGGGGRALGELAAALGRQGEGLRARAARRLAEVARQASRGERGLRKVEEAVERFRPFVAEHEHVFASEVVEALSARLPEGERQRFGWGVPELDWGAYWPEVQLPGLETWVYPRLEGRRPPREPRRPLPALNSDPAPDRLS